MRRIHETPTMHLRLILFVIAVAALLVPAVGRTQSITLSPAAVPLKGSQGQSVTQVLTLHNHSDVALTFMMEAQDVIVRDGARVFVPAGEIADSIATSALFSPRQLTVEARSSATVSVTLTLPHAMHHRAVVAFFRGLDLLPTGDRMARLSLGTLFTFTVSDQISMTAALTAEPPTVTDNARIVSTLVNDGEEPVVPSGVAVILDARGHLIGKAPFPTRRLLPGESATLAADYLGDLAAGTYRVIATFDVAGRAMTQSAVLDVQ